MGWLRRRRWKSVSEAGRASCEARLRSLAATRSSRRSDALEKEGEGTEGAEGAEGEGTEGAKSSQPKPEREGSAEEARDSSISMDSDSAARSGWREDSSKSGTLARSSERERDGEDGGASWEVREAARVKGVSDGSREERMEASMRCFSASTRRIKSFTRSFSAYTFERSAIGVSEHSF